MTKRWYIKNSKDGFYHYFTGVYHKAIDCIKNGKRAKGLRILNKGSKLYSKLFKKGELLNSLIYDKCSLYLSNYYERNRKLRRLNKIRRRNFVEYNGDYYILSTNTNFIKRVIPLSELKENEDYGVDFPLDKETNRKVLMLIQKRRS